MSEPKLTIEQVAELISSVSQASRSQEARQAGLINGGWYSTEDVAALIGVDPSTLRRWRTSKPMQGPPFVRLTSRITVYSVPDVQAWMESRRIVPGEAA
ncbi:helix-turn-helix domain-containing protein [Kitasatospora sp. NPDC127111]|uniref:helix-turn-helix transcriptional regulator n=1 Tax=Kitasatospora sp. NPDC127111 TaxID=3345363 RepID=UPI003634A399